jgi:hypothetical protein
MRAQLLLANLYNLGQGVAENPIVACALYTVSLEMMHEAIPPVIIATILPAT